MLQAKPVMLISQLRYKREILLARAYNRRYNGFAHTLLKEIPMARRDPIRAAQLRNKVRAMISDDPLGHKDGNGSQSRLAEEFGVTKQRVSQIVKQERSGWQPKTRVKKAKKKSTRILLGEDFKRLRFSYGLSESEVARIFGIEKSQVWGYEQRVRTRLVWSIWAKRIEQAKKVHMNFALEFEGLLKIPSQARQPES